MDVFDFDDYKVFVRQTLESLPKQGHGSYRKMAEHLNTSSVMISQIFRGDRHLTPEQACRLSDFFGLSEPATDFFILLVQYQRAGTRRYQERLKKKIEELRGKSRDLQSRLVSDVEMSDQAKAHFYSRWYYSAVRLATAVDGIQSPEQIAKKLNLTVLEVNRVLQFLVENNLCIQEGSRFGIGPRQTHVGSDSPFVGRHHLNWRTKAMSRIDVMSAEELFYTGPMSLSLESMERIRAELVLLTEKVREEVKRTEPETLACLNIDWFKIE